MVIKFNPAGRVIRVFGRRLESADDKTKAWDSEGNIYISDGYVNSRVAKYDKNGDWAN